jgi:LPXTG-site transpeptidase (sortase) family protein
MGSVIERTRFLRLARLPREKKIYLVIFATYFLAAFAFVVIGLQPTKSSAAVYATEAETATSLLTIDSINLNAPVKKAALNGKTLEVPEQIAGSYSVHKNKTLIIGHSSTIFTHLYKLKLGDKISYNGKEYTIRTIEEKQKQDIVMKDILKAEEKDTLVLMTCSGEKIAESTSDHTHRLIITAD